MEYLGTSALMTMLAGGQLAIFDERTDMLGYALLAVAALAGFLFYIRSTALPLLLLGVAATSLLIPQLVSDATDGVLGLGGVWLLGGLALMTSLLAAWRVREEHLNQPEC